MPNPNLYVRPFAPVNRVSHYLQLLLGFKPVLHIGPGFGVFLLVSLTFWLLADKTDVVRCIPTNRRWQTIKKNI